LPYTARLDIAKVNDKEMRQSSGSEPWWPGGDNRQNFHACLFPEFLEAVPIDCLKVNVTEILSLKPKDKERPNFYALKRLNEWQGRILSRLPHLRQLSEKQVSKDLATYLDENEIAEFQKCLADIIQWLSKCMDTGDRFNSYAYAEWVITPMSRVECLVAKAYQAKEHKKRWSTAYYEVNPPDRDAKTYLTDEEYEGFVKAAVQAVRACIEKGEDYLSDARSLDYRRYLAEIRDRKEKEKLLSLARLAAEEFNRQLNGEKVRVRSLLSPNRKDLEGYFRRQVKDCRYLGHSFYRLLSKEEEQAFDKTLVRTSRQKAEQIVANDFRSFITTHCWRSFFLLLSTDYVLEEIPCLGFIFDVFAVVETGVWLKPGQKEFNGYVFDFPWTDEKEGPSTEESDFLGYYHLVLTPEELGGWSFWQNIPLVLLKGLLRGETQPSGTVIVAASDDAVTYEIAGFTEEVEIPTQFAEYLERIGSIDEMIWMGIMSDRVGSIVKAPLAELEAERKTPPTQEKGRRRDSVKERAFCLFDEGKRPDDPKVKSLGMKPNTAYRYYQEWKRTQNRI